MATYSSREQAQRRRRKSLTVRELMRPAVVTVERDAHPHTTAAGAAVEMISAHVRHLPVVAGGRLVGLIDISDACRGLVEERQDLS